MRFELKLFICILITALVVPRAYGLTSDGLGTIYIPSSKNLGIGTKNPAARVHVNGNLLINDGTQMNGFVLTSDANGLASWQAAATGGSEWIDAGSFLYPADSLGSESVIIGGTTIFSSDIALNSDGSAVFNEQGNAVNLRVEGSSDQYLLVANGSSNQVGIGTANTAEILTINGALAFSEIIAPGPTVGFGKVYVKSSDSILYYKDGLGNEYDLTVGASANPAGSNGYVQFNTGGAFDANENFFWQNSNGRLSLGHSDPDTVLDINGAFTYRDLDGVEPNPPDNNASVLWMSDGSTANGDAGDTMVKTSIGGVTKTFTLIDFDGFNDPTYNGLTLNGLTANRLVRTDGSRKLQSETNLIVDGAGNVGIGVLTPSSLLDVGGGIISFVDGIDDVLIKDDLEVDGDIYGSQVNVSGAINGNTINGITITGTNFIGGSFNGVFIGDGSGITGLTADAAGSAGWIQFNNGNNFDANGKLFWDITDERLSLGHSDPDTVLDINGAFTYRDLDGVEPNSPDDNASVLWMSDGSTANGDAGDTMVKTTIGGVTKTFTLIDFDGFNDPTYNGLTLNGLTANRLIRTDGSNKLQSETNLIVDGAGNVAVGLNSPNERLTVNGALSLDVLSSAPSASVGFGKFYANGTSLFFKNSSGSEFDLTDINPAGLNTEIQFNNLGTFGSSPNLTWDGNNLNTLNVQVGLGSAFSPSYSFLGNNNTGLYSPGLNSLGFSTGGTQRLIINGIGNVGISQPNPGAKMELNGTLAYTPSTIVNISSGTGITADKTIMNIQGNGGPVDISINPQITAGIDGQYLILKGSSNINTVKLDDGMGLTLEGGIPFTLGSKDTIILIYDVSSSTWLETSRSNKI